MLRRALGLRTADSTVRCARCVTRLCPLQVRCFKVSAADGGVHPAVLCSVLNTFMENPGSLPKHVLYNKCYKNYARVWSLYLSVVSGQVR